MPFPHFYYLFIPTSNSTDLVSSYNQNGNSSSNSCILTVHCFGYLSFSYIAIVYPFRAQLQTTHAKWLILIAWTIGFVLVIPFVLALELRDGECQEDFEAVGMVAGAYTLCVFVAQYVVPLTIIVFCYRRWAI